MVETPLTTVWYWLPEPFSLATITIEELVGIVPLMLIVPDIFELPVVWLDVWLVLLLVLFCKTVKVPMVDFEEEAFGLAVICKDDCWAEALGVGEP